CGCHRPARCKATPPADHGGIATRRPARCASAHETTPFSSGQALAERSCVEEADAHLAIRWPALDALAPRRRVVTDAWRCDADSPRFMTQFRRPRDGVSSPHAHIKFQNVI